jgi:hypothetical protein
VFPKLLVCFSSLTACSMATSNCSVSCCIRCTPQTTCRAYQLSTVNVAYLLIEVRSARRPICNSLMLIQVSFPSRKPVAIYMTSKLEATLSCDWLGIHSPLRKLIVSKRCPSKLMCRTA